MPVPAADPEAVALDAAFAQAMGAAPKPKEPPAPPDVDPEAPHGRGDDGEPKAPYGWTTGKDGPRRPKLAPGGRPRKDPDAKARTGPDAVTSAPAVDDAKTGKVIAPKDWSGPLLETADSLWVGMTFLGQLPLERLPLAGRIKTGNGKTLADRLAGAEVRLQAQAHLLDANKGALVAGLNIAAQNNARARRLAEKLETGDVTWVIMAGAMVAPFVMQSRALWGGTLAGHEMPSAEEMARANEASMQAWIARFNAAVAQTAQAGAQAAAVANAAAQQA